MTDDGHFPSLPVAELSLLDPSRNALRWESQIQLLAHRGALAHRRQQSMQSVLSRGLWSSLAVAAAAGLSTWLLPGETTADTTEPGVALLHWASADEVPAVAEVLRTFQKHGEAN